MHLFIVERDLVIKKITVHFYSFTFFLNLEYFVGPIISIIVKINLYENCGYYVDNL